MLPTIHYVIMATIRLAPVTSDLRMCYVWRTIAGVALLPTGHPSPSRVGHCSTTGAQSNHHHPTHSRYVQCKLKYTPEANII